MFNRPTNSVVCSGTRKEKIWGFVTSLTCSKLWGNYEYDVNFLRHVMTEYEKAFSLFCSVFRSFSFFISFHLFWVRPYNVLVHVHSYTFMLCFGSLVTYKAHLPKCQLLCLNAKRCHFLTMKYWISFRCACLQIAYACCLLNTRRFFLHEFFWRQSNVRHIHTHNNAKEEWISYLYMTLWNATNLWLPHNFSQWTPACAACEMFET